MKGTTTTTTRLFYREIHIVAVCKYNEEKYVLFQYFSGTGFVKAKLDVF